MNNKLKPTTLQQATMCNRDRCFCIHENRIPSKWDLQNITW